VKSCCCGRYSCGRCRGSARRSRGACSLRWCGVNFGRRPSLTPRALARFHPSAVRARIRSRSNSASPPSTLSIKRPCAVVVSAHASARDRNPPSLPVIAARVVSGRARQPLEPRHHHHVAGADPGQQPAKLRPVGVGSARHFAEHLPGSGSAKLAHLCRLTLPARRYTRVPVDHSLIVR
jgi:hypothetical protein